MLLTIKSQSYLVGDENIRDIKKGQIVQFERRGYFICDVEYKNDESPAVFIVIPDGKAKTPAPVPAPKTAEAKKSN